MALSVCFFSDYEKLVLTGQCGGNYNYNFGHVVSPNYPRMYKNGVVCIWTITIPAGAVMAFRFTDIDIEDHIDCQYDSVEVTTHV